MFLKHCALVKSFLWLNVPFPSYFVPLFLDLSYENFFDLHENEPWSEKQLHMEWFCTKTRFDTEAKSNSEMPITQSEFVLSKHFLSGIL